MHQRATSAPSGRARVGLRGCTLRFYVGCQQALTETKTPQHRQYAAALLRVRALTTCALHRDAHRAQVTESARSCSCDACWPLNSSLSCGCRCMQALKQAGCTEVILAISYRAEVRPPVAPTACTIYQCTQHSDRGSSMRQHKPIDALGGALKAEAGLPSTNRAASAMQGQRPLLGVSIAAQSVTWCSRRTRAT